MELGEYNTLKAARYTSVGLFLEDESGESVLLPMKWVPEGTKEGEELEVFIYLDNEQRPIATTLKPKATVGEFTSLEVRQMTKLGAFLDWGLEKDLFVPFKEQHEKMQAGHSYPVFIYLDEKSERIVGSSKIDKYTQPADEDLEEGQEVDLLIGYPTDLGYKVIIDNYYSGLIFKNEIHRKIKTGDETKGYIKSIREDGKIDVVLEKPGYASVEPNAQHILDKLRENDGFLPLHDKSDPEAIKAQLGMSKKVFKKAIGSLYKQKLVVIEENGIKLV